MPTEISMGVIGVGHFGRIHAEKISRLPGMRLIAVADTIEDRAREVGDRLGATPVVNHEELFGMVDAVVVAVPTTDHYRIARDFLEHEIDVLVEKPITADVESARELVEIARDRGRILQVGHLERFSGLIEAVKRYSRRPLYIDSVRISPFKTRGTDISVILDLMVHDLDLIMCLVNSPIISADAAGSPIFSSSEDIASVRMKFADGCVANIVASRVSRKSERRMRIFEYEKYLTADLEQRTIQVVSRAADGSPRGFPAIKIHEESYDGGDPLEKEIMAFATSVRERSTPLVSGEDGIAVLEAAVRVNDSLQAHTEFLRRAEAELTGLRATR